jgi:hypothetical protein
MMAVFGVLLSVTAYSTGANAQTTLQGRNQAVHGTGSFTRGCAARDIQVLDLIEERAGEGGMSAQHSTDAIVTVMHARMVCFEGRVVNALAIYDRVSESVMSYQVQFGQRQGWDAQEWRE